MTLSKIQTERARDLRRGVTPQEKHLWYDFLNSHSARFRRQRPIGDYIVDFYSDRAQLVIELDGSQHFTRAARDYDNTRTQFLESKGLIVIRFTNLDVDVNFDGVCRAIEAAVALKVPPPSA